MAAWSPRSTGWRQRRTHDPSLLRRQRPVRRQLLHDLWREAVRGNVQVVVTQHVLREAEDSLARKAPEALAALHELLELVAPELAELPTLQELRQAATYINLKDAPIVAGAVKARVDYLVTWDRKHFLDDTRVARESGLKIVTPDELITLIRK